MGDRRDRMEGGILKTGPFDKWISLRGGNTVHLSKETEEAEWYITVTAKDGCYSYDGWWRDSSEKTWQEALHEAKRGACL